MFKERPSGERLLEVAGSTRLLGIIGDPIDQVRSPSLFNQLFMESHKNAICVPFHVPAKQLTVPHKREMTALVEHLDETSRQVGAVNVARREPDGTWTGAIFDGWGCVLGLLWDGYDPAGQRVLLIGAGGAGSAIAFALAKAGARRISIFDVDLSLSTAVADAMRQAVPGCETRLSPPDPADHDIVINASPVGMQRDDPLPIDPDQLRPGSVVVDIITKPDPTRLCEAALARGCHVQGGQAMHEGQAVYASRFFGLSFWPPGRPVIDVPQPVSR
jgi:shikimate dehydrogenase